MATKGPRLVLQQKQVMSGFCYAYSKALVEKLKTMLDAESQQIVDKDGRLQPMAYAVISALTNQIDFGSYGNELQSLSIRILPQEVRLFANRVEEYLTIFEA